MKESKKLDHLIFFFFNFTHKGQNYLTIIEHILLFQYTFFLPEFKLYTCICPPHERVTSWCGLNTRTRIFLSRFWEQISQPLFNDPLSYAIFFRTPFNGRYRQVWLYIDKKNMLKSSIAQFYLWKRIRREEFFMLYIYYKTVYMVHKFLL